MSLLRVVALGLVVVSAACASPRGGESERHRDLSGTAWQLVEIQSMDGTTLQPDESAKYTLTFGGEGHLAARIDCNRGAGTWKATPAGELTLGPLATTRAMCPPHSLHDRFVRDLGYVRSYVTEDGRLFLSLMADGGIYVFEPLPPA
jgi:para-nitrobenzyl esterase